MSRPVRSLVPLALLSGAILLAAACGGGGDDRTAGIIHRLLLAAGTTDTAALESFVGRLPDDLPVAPPQYPGAKLIVSSQQPAPFSDFSGNSDDDTGSVPQPMLYFIVLDTDSDREQVFAFYEQALDEDPWQIESSFSTTQLDTFQFVNVEDPDIAGAVSIAKGAGDGRTSILISLQDAGAFREEEPPFQLGESLSIPKEFPPDLPLYRGATVTDTAFFREPGSESFLLIFLTMDGQDDVIEFYRDEFEQRGWTVLEGATFGLAERIEFRDEGRDIQGEVLADRFADARSYTEVTIQVQVNSAREPAAGGDTTPEPTEADDEPS